MEKIDAEPEEEEEREDTVDFSLFDVSEKFHNIFRLIFIFSVPRFLEMIPH